MGEDLNLGYHFDNAEVTLNVCIGKNFTEGNLYFGDMKQVSLHTIVQYIRKNVNIFYIDR